MKRHLAQVLATKLARNEVMPNVVHSLEVFFGYLSFVSIAELNFHTR